MALLEVCEVTKNFGGLTAVMEMNITVERGEIFGLIGPNGAGKSTLLNLIDGSLRPSQGEVLFNGKEISNLPAHQHSRYGIARVFQENLLFGSFSVLENVIAGTHLQYPMRFRDIFFRSSTEREHDRVIQDRALQLLECVGLAPYMKELARNLPHGQQRLLSLAIALATQPQLLLLDEPVTGMTAEEVDAMLALIRWLRDRKEITCILIEHNLKAVMGLCDRIAVLNFGVKIAEGSPAQIVADPAVTAAYLGMDENAA